MVTPPIFLCRATGWGGEDRIGDFLADVRQQCRFSRASGSEDKIISTRLDFFQRGLLLAI